MAEHNAVKQHHRKRNEGNQGKRKRHLEHEDVGKNDRKAAYYEVFRTMMGYLSYLEQIVCDAAHYSSCLGPVKIGERQILKMIEEVLPHLIFYPHAQNMPPAYPDVRADGLKDIDSEHDGKDHKHHSHIALGNRPVKQVIGQQRKNDRQK